MAHRSGYSELTALVVDNFDSFRTTVCKMLKEFGVGAIDTAGNGNQALKACYSNDYDLVLCDYNLGPGRSGQHVLEELRFRKALKRSSLFVLLSAETDKSMIMAAFDNEPDAYLSKPITTRALQQRLDRLLQQRDELLRIHEAIAAGSTERAIALCRQKIEKPGRYTGACQKLLGTLYLQHGAHEAAEALYRQVLQVRQLDWARVGLARVRQAQGDVAMAAQWLGEIVRGNPLCMPAYDALAENCQCRRDPQQLQAVLQQAAAVSPRSILRQKYLAETAAGNNDLPVAASAYRRTVRLGQYSCHDCIENHINFGRAVAALFREERRAAEDLSRDALRVLADIPRRFEPTAEQGGQTRLVESQVYAGQGNRLRAGVSLQAGEETLQQLPAPLSVETQLDHAMALSVNGKRREADKLLTGLIEHHRNDQQALEKIDRLLEEPQSDANRRTVAELNRSGIGHYNDRQFKQAIEYFMRAKRLFPNHIGVHLNLVQALLGEMQEYGREEERLKLCSATIAKIESRIDHTHRQYGRFAKLRHSLVQLERE